MICITATMPARAPDFYYLAFRPAVIATILALILVGAGMAQESTEDRDDLLSSWAELQAELQSRLQANDPNATALAEEVFELTVRLFGQRHRNIVKPVVHLALAHQVAGDNLTARSYFTLALGLSEELLGSEDSSTATIHNFIGNIDLALGDTKSAREHLERSVSIMESQHGADSLEAAHALRGLANIHFATGDLEQTAGLLARIVEIHEQRLGPRHEEMATDYNNLAYVLHQTERYKEAQALMEKALAIHRGLPAPDGLRVADDLNGLGMIHLSMGDPAAALLYFEESLDIYRKRYPEGHADTASVLSNLGYVLTDLQRYTEAEAAFLEALDMEKSLFGEEHPSLACTLNGLQAIPTRNIASTIGDLPRALEELKPALDPWQTESAIAHSLGVALNADACIDLAASEPEDALEKLTQSIAALEGAFGTESPELVKTLVNRALALYATGRTAEAVESTTRALDIQERTLANMMATGALEEAETFLGTVSSETAWALTLQRRVPSTQATRLGLTTALRRKGRDLETRARPPGLLEDPETDELLKALRQTREEWAYLQLHTDPSTAALAMRSEVLASRLRLLGSKIREAQRRHGAVPIPETTIDAVQGRIPEDAALIEMVVAEATEHFVEISGAKPRYLAYVLHRHGEPAAVDLGEAETINRAVASFRRSLAGDGNDVSEQARRLDELTMARLRPLLEDAQRLLLSPDGPLNLVPFAALVDESGSYLVERYLMTYLSSGRDLLRAEPVPSREPPLILGHPELDGEMPTAMSRLSATSRSPLPGTAREVTSIATTLGLPPSRTLLGPSAREGAVKNARGPSILHLATHGFFFDDEMPAPTSSVVEPSVALLDPMLRSGLLLSNRHPATASDDGVLTAAEVMDLDLVGTEIVSLSACETGVGEIRAGRGVYGLRRALVLSGARTQIMSLWRIDDRATADLMASFYAQVATGMARGEALRQTQLAALKGDPLPETLTVLPRGAKTLTGATVSSSHPFFWAGLILAGDTGPINGNPISAPFPVDRDQTRKVIQ